MIAANKDWRMAKAYSIFMRGWRDNGGKLFVNFSAPRTYQWFGSWGTKEYITQPIAKAPKHRALMQYARQNPCWWRGCSSPTIVRLDKPATNPIGDVFALVPTKKRNKPVKPVVIAKAKTTPVKPAVVAKTVKKPTTVIPKVAKTVVKAATKAVIAKQTSPATIVLNNKDTLFNAGKTIASTISKPIWESTTLNSNSRTNKKSTVAPKAKQTITQTKTKQQHDAVVHRVKGRGRFWANKTCITS